MQTFRLKSLILAYAVGAGLALQASPSLAFDASKVISEDTSSSKVFEFFFNFRDSGKKEEAVQLLKYAADQGNAAAQWKLARIYQTGDGVEQDPQRAFDMFQKVAEKYPLAKPNTPNWQFSAHALVSLGDYYKSGISGSDIEPDLAKAQMMYTTAAMVFRHPDAQFELGRMQLLNDNGFGHHRLGIRNLSLAYKKGHVGAEALLGYAIFEGEFIKRNPVRGLIMLGNARNRASQHDLEWISPLYEEAYALASPEHRLAAQQELGHVTVSAD